MDPETRMKVADVIKEECPLRTVLVEKKPCPYFGPSISCRDCTYEWIPIADNVGKLVKARRAAYEQEKEKVKEIAAELEKQLATVKALVGGVQVFKDIWEILAKSNEDQQEEGAGGEVEDSDKES